MKKIMFNDMYGLTQLVLEGRKTMTRRIITCPKKFRGQDVSDFLVCTDCCGNLTDVYMCDANYIPIYGGQLLPRYKVGEVVAIAQSYKEISNSLSSDDKMVSFPFYFFYRGNKINVTPGWYNKMFVKADVMPHHIRITDIKVERLQDISDEDCLKEGVTRIKHIVPTAAQQYYLRYMPCRYMEKCAEKVGWGRTYDTPQQAFAVLIDCVSGKGTWESNPWVWAYEFMLID